MSIIRLFIIVMVTIGICFAQTISISGMIKNSTGEKISGATVLLEKSAISSLSDEEGRFVLNGSSTAIYRSKLTEPAELFNVNICNNQLYIKSNFKTSISLCTYTTTGKCLSNNLITLNVG